MSEQLKDLHFFATRLQSMAADGHGYFAQNDIARMIETADVMFAADARIAALEAENERLRNALEPFAEVAGRFDGLAVSAILPQQCWFTPNSLREARAARATTGDKSAPSEPSKEQIERAIEAYREGVYLTDEQVHASVTAIVRAALSPSPQPMEVKP